MKANPENFQFMIPSKTRRPKYGLLVDSNVIKESMDVELLRLIIDNKPMFEKHIAKLCQTASRHSPCTQTNKKILALALALAIRKYLYFNDRMAP